MKKQNIFIALFLAGFMLLFFGSVSSAHDPNMPPPSGEHHDPNMPPPSGEHHDPSMPPPGGCDPNLAPAGEGAGGVTGNHGGPNDHHNGPGDHHCPPGTTCGGPNDHHGDQEASHCAAMGMADGSPHVDPPQDIIDQVSAEYEANCKSGNCFLGEGNYKLLEDMGHTRAKVDCFLADGHRKHEEQHGGPGDVNHPPAP